MIDFKSKNSDITNKIIYEVYIRNHSSKGTIKELTLDIPRIKNLGVDIIWCMPIHPIGTKNKKGELGCPYSIKDYFEINPEYGSIEDFKLFLDTSHKSGLKVFIDIVFNHCAWDSKLALNNPEYLFKKNGEPSSKISDWSDVVDFDFGNRALFDELLKVLKFWHEFGVDGFRCDVAPLVPLDFWEMAKVHAPGIYLAETTPHHFIEDMKKEGYRAHHNVDLKNVFDMLYDSQSFWIFDQYLQEKADIKDYLSNVNKEMNDGITRLRFIENHDTPRIASRISSKSKLKACTAHMFFLPGPTLLYAGQEFAETTYPSLFEKNEDIVGKLNLKNEEKENFYSFISNLIKLKKEILSQPYDVFKIETENETCIEAFYEKGYKKIAGIFNVNGLSQIQLLKIPDGKYKNLIDNKDFIIEKNNLDGSKISAFILEF